MNYKYGVNHMNFFVKCPCVKQSYDFKTGNFFDENEVSQNISKGDHINSVWHTEIFFSLPAP